MHWLIILVILWVVFRQVASLWADGYQPSLEPRPPWFPHRHVFNEQPTAARILQCGLLGFAAVCIAWAFFGG